MMHSVRGLGLAATLALISSLGVVPQAKAQATTTAHVYVQVQGPAGPVYAFNSSSSTGHVSAIAGSPFKPGTQIIAGTTSRFFTMGQTLVHSWAVESNGAIGRQLSQIAVQDYAGSACWGGYAGGDSAVLDHTGKYIYVLLENNGACAAYQSYKINSDGSFVFDGDTELNQQASNGSGSTLPSILKNESFAYASYGFQDSGPVIIGFRRETSGTLQLMQFHETDPTLANDYYVTGLPDASPAGSYLAVQLHPEGGGPTQFGSYTVDSQGNISTTNTSGDMPASAFLIAGTTFSPSGNLLVAYTDGAETNGKSGIEIYKFNGAAPLTLYKKLLTGTPIDGAAWDKSNHLYAISKADNKLYVFTVTTTSVTQDSAISIGSPFRVVVVSE